MENSQIVDNRSIIVKIQDFVSNQDNNQKINVAISVALELYRLLVSSLLILFVPQDCGGHLCTLSENMETNSQIYTTGLFFNFATMFVFLLMYGIEVKRENRLITYLDVNKSNACDNDSVGKVLQKLPSQKRNNILTLDIYYQKVAYVAMCSFVINSIISGIVVYQYSLGNQTTTTIITNILFMVSKLSDVYLTVNTEKNIFYSAYLKGKIQYNDVDPDKIKLLELVEFSDIESPPVQQSVPLVTEEQSHPIQEDPVPLVTEEQSHPIQEDPVQLVTEEQSHPIQEDPVQLVTEEQSHPIQEDPVPLVTEEQSHPIQEDPVPLVTEEQSPPVQEDPVLLVTEEQSPPVQEDPVPQVIEEQDIIVTEQYVL
jgi:cytochrome b subunit of formate dehydrogenase